MYASGLRGVIGATSLLLAVACAQEALSPDESTPVNPDAIDVARINPGRAVYRSTRITDGVFETHLATETISLAEAYLDGNRAWRLVKARQTLNGTMFTDTIYAGFASVMPLRQVTHSMRPGRPARLIRQVDFRTNSVVAFFSERTFPVAIPSDIGPIVLDANHFRLLLSSLDLDSLPTVSATFIDIYRAWNGDPNILKSVSARVVGEETIRVPAGEFVSWRLDLTEHTWWVSKETGWLVKSERKTESDFEYRYELVFWEPAN